MTTYTLTYWQGVNRVTKTVPRSHYDLAVAYLSTGHPRATIDDVDEVIVNFSEDELRDMKWSEDV